MKNTQSMSKKQGRRFPGRRSILLALILLAAGLSAGAQPTSQQVDAEIQKHRKGSIVIHAPPGTQVTVEQQRHEFWFGAALANQAFNGRMSSADRDKYLSIFLSNFNSAVTENALKWHDMEPRRGEVNYATVDAMLKWTDQQQIPLRGHNIYWGIPNRVQNWLKELPDDQLLEAIKQRAFDVGRRYRGRFAEYDLNNEMIHGNYYEERLGENITLHMARWVKEADPKAVLYLNDYDILTGRRLDDYLRHIRKLLDQEVPIDGIGVQGHLHAESFEPKALHHALEKLSAFGLPIRITEFNMPGQRSRFYKDRNLRMTPDEERAKAESLVEYYRICFAYPQVEGILMWGFWEGANWIPVSSLYRRDWTPLPAADAYRDLVFGQWWTNWRGRTDSEGKCVVSAFYGQHIVKAGDKQETVNLRKADGQQKITFQGP
jgi:endo-1,4-beta-xylanase